MELFIPGPEGRLEATYQEALDIPSGGKPRAVAAICHPHPVHGGNMHSTVTFRIARGLQRAGIACVRFNFRGVGQSEGGHCGEGGEVEDLRTVLNWLHKRFPRAPTWAGGFSFGSRTAFALALEDTTIERLFLIGFPAKVYPLEGVDTLQIPALFVSGTEDEFGTLADLREQYPILPEHFELQEVKGADHFFKPRTRVVEDRVHEYATRMLKSE
jgi:alpha/beta superfamily hydrolase